MLRAVLIFVSLMFAVFLNIASLLPSVAQNMPALVTNGGNLSSFSDAINLPLVTDADYGRFVDPQVTGVDRSIAISLLRFMPANKRGDFVYVSPSGRILSNRLAVGFSVRFTSKALRSVQRPTTINRSQLSRLRPFGRLKPAAYPPTVGTGGAFIRTYSAQGISAAYGYVNPPCDYGLQANESGNMYFNAYDSNGGDVTDAGIGTGQNAATRNSDGTPNGESVSFVNFGANQYWSSGWTNQSQLYSCGNPVGIMYGTVPFLVINNQITSMLATGTPDYDPSQLSLPLASTTWTSGAWTFWPTRSGLITGQTTWNGVESVCSACSIGRMITIGQNGGLNYNGSCYGYCTSAGADAFWYETVAGQLIPTCTQSQGQSETCTILGATSWVGGEVDSQQGIAYSPLNDQYAAEGINLNPFANTSARRKALNYPLPPAPANQCLPDSHGYCAAIVSTTDTGVCVSQGVGGKPISHSSYKQQSYVFQGKPVAELLATVTETVTYTLKNTVCTSTSSWSPWNPSVHYNDPLLL